MAEIIDIVELIEKNPYTRLSKKYLCELVEKIKKKLTEKEQHIFVANFFCYLNFNQKKDFIIDLNKIWKWMGFHRKEPAKIILKKHFIEDIDYKIVFQKPLENSKKEKTIKNKLDEKNGGDIQEEQFLMTVDTFKKFCLKTNTKKSDEIQDCYIKLEELLIETINEETEELRNQLQIKDKQLHKINKQLHKINKQLQIKDNELKDKEIEIQKKNNKEKKHETSKSIIYDFTPEQILKQQELDNNLLLESKKLDNDLLLNLSKNKLYENIIKEKLESLFENFDKNNQKTETHLKIKKDIDISDEDISESSFDEKKETKLKKKKK